MVFARPAALRRHVEGTGKYCWSGLKAHFKLDRREDNVTDVVARRLQNSTFLRFLVSTVKRQRSLKGRGPLFFIPYGKTPFLTADVYEIGRRFRCAVAGVKKRGLRRDELRARALSTAFAICLYWTDRAVDTIGILPAKWTCKDERLLRKRFERVARRKQPITSPVIQACVFAHFLRECRGFPTPTQSFHPIFSTLPLPYQPAPTPPRRHLFP